MRFVKRHKTKLTLYFLSLVALCFFGYQAIIYADQIQSIVGTANLQQGAPGIWRHNIAIPSTTTDLTGIFGGTTLNIGSGYSTVTRSILHAVEPGGLNQYTRLSTVHPTNLSSPTANALNVGLGIRNGDSGTALLSATYPNDDLRGNTNSGILSSLNFVYNGGTFDRNRSANAADATGGQGVPANGLMAFGNDSLWHRVRTNTTGDIYTGSTPIQSGITNSQTTGAANTAVAVTLTASATQQSFIHSISARCSAGTATLTVTDGTSTVWSTSTGAVTTTNFEKYWNTALSSTANADPVITLSACGAGNTGTLIVQASIRPN
jgi:hypothetical protein